VATNTQDAGSQTQKQIGSWSWRWNTKKPTEVSEREIEQPWAGVAEWLRAAHSLLDEKAAK